MKAEHCLLIPVSVACCLPGLESKGFAGGDNLKPMSHVWIVHHLHSHALQRYPLNHLHTQMERERGRGGEREEREREREREAEAIKVIQLIKYISGSTNHLLRISTYAYVLVHEVHYKIVDMKIHI